MSSPKSGKIDPSIILGFILVMMIGFMVTASFIVNEEFSKSRLDLVELRAEVKKQIEELNDSINKRYLTMLSLSEKISEQQSKMGLIERSIASERDALTKIEENFRADLDQAKKLGGDATKEVATLEQEFKQEVKLKEVRIAKLQDSYDSIKTQVDDQQALIAIMREQALMNKYQKPQDGTTTVDPNGGTQTGASAQPTTSTPAAAAPSTTTPMNTRVVTELPDSSTPKSNSN